LNCFSDSSPISPLTGLPTGRYNGETASPNASRQAFRVASNSARWWSILVMTTARGMPTAAHSSHSILVTPSIPSVAETAKSAESAARSPARRSPVKSAYPGESSRLTLMPLWTTGARVKLTERCCLTSTSSKSLTVVPSSMLPGR